MTTHSTRRADSTLLINPLSVQIECHSRDVSEFVRYLQHSINAGRSVKLDRKREIDDTRQL